MSKNKTAVGRESFFKTILAFTEDLKKNFSQNGGSNKLIISDIHIPDRAAYDMKNLTSVVISNSVKSIDSFAFLSCSALS